MRVCCVFFPILPPEKPPSHRLSPLEKPGEGLLKFPCFLAQEPSLKPRTLSLNPEIPDLPCVFLPCRRFQLVWV
ncbi:hypothetical protein SLEP1_g18703 [Rubroshorea leprosula]|uniref:Uncharacterized protein n=1 Tax=Rubroshorea leprosula TaxID=152421 RepID=A0AAV5J4G1_9ROSI|nr:hypothetical protein SLEP1_g18703 [Rubroshorea leprosula]